MCKTSTMRAAYQHDYPPCSWMILGTAAQVMQARVKA